jgi:hypothetical protein
MRQFTDPLRAVIGAEYSREQYFTTLSQSDTASGIDVCSIDKRQADIGGVLRCDKSQGER